MQSDTSYDPIEAERVLVLRRTFDAPRALVFKVWTEPKHVVRWFGPNDFTVPHCEMDFRVGGTYRNCMRAPDGVDHWVWGEYLEIEPPERIVFTWNREDAEGNPKYNTVVTITLAEENGKTALTLHQALFATTEDRDDHRHGWSECIVRLAAYVESL